MNKFYVDGSHVKIEGNDFDLTLPNGVHVRGTNADPLAAAEAARSVWILTQWEKGQQGHNRYFGGEGISAPAFVVPLK